LIPEKAAAIWSATETPSPVPLTHWSSRQRARDLGVSHLSPVLEELFQQAVEDRETDLQFLRQAGDGLLLDQMSPEDRHRFLWGVVPTQFLHSVLPPVF
jgi:hypothetical protein